MSAPGPEVSANASGSRGWKRHGAGLISLLASGALLAALYRTLDVRLVGRAIVQSDLPWLALALGMIIPITLLRALRFYLVAPPGAMPGPWEAVRLTLVASAVNVFLPGKGGEVLAANADVDFTFGEKPPLVSFAGEGVILPTINGDVRYWR